MTPAEELHALNGLNYGDMPCDVATRMLRRRSRLERKLASDPLGVLIRRLEARQRDLEAACGRFLLEAADLAGMAAERRLKQGEGDPVAATLQAQADAATECGERRDEMAVRLSVRIATLKRRREFGLAVVAMLGERS